MVQSAPTPTLSRCLLACFLAAALFLTGCGGSSDSAEVIPEEVDEDTPMYVTDDEREDFASPEDSVLTEEQVTQFLKASLLQFDLVRKHSESLHERVGEMEKRGEDGGAIAGLRNLVEAGRTMAEVGDVIGGSFIRSARTLGYNPAEMEWVRERVLEVSSYLMMKPMYESAARQAQDLQEQVEALRQQGDSSGAVFSEEDVQQMMASAAEMAQNATQGAAPAVMNNLEVLHEAKPAVTDAMWSAIGVTGGAMGLVALTGLADPNDAEAQQKLTELRQLFEDALANRISPGMEEGAEAPVEETAE